MFAGLMGLLLAACGGGGDAAPATDPQTTTTTLAVAAAPASAAGGGVATPPVAADPAVARRSEALAFSFDLPAARTTSAGVYAADGTLVRTLWRGERLGAGRLSRRWDHRYDNGTLAPAGAYTVRLIHHDLSYRWDGVVGNTSVGYGAVPHRSYQPPTALTLDGTQLHFGVGYNEGQPVIQGFDTRQPQKPAPRVGRTDPFIGVGLLASDGTRLYAANTGGISSIGFVAAFDLATGTLARFGQGQPLCLARMNDGVTCYGPQNYPSVISVRSSGEPMPTGLAVQRNGNLLAVAYGGENTVRLFDKTSGQLVAQLQVPLAAHSTNQIAMSAGGDLWVVSVTAVLRYTDLATRPRLALAIAGLDRPLAVATDPGDDDTVWVADGGASQQLKRYGRGGAPGSVIGQPGGMAGSAAVGADRLCFQFGGNREQTALAVDAQHRVWVVDTCNNRMLHLGAGGELLDQVAYLPTLYVATVDGGRPERVFAAFMEFEVDYARDLSSAGAWRLVRNWLPVLPAALRDADSRNWGWTGFPSVQTLSNGRTYALLNVARRQVIVELTASGTVREVVRLPQTAAGQSMVVLYEGGELGYARDVGGRQVVYRQRVEGFDAAGNPVWASQPAVVASVPKDATAPFHRIGTFTGISGPRYPITASGMVVYFSPSVADPDGFHLGAAARGGTQWAWQASASGPLDGRGNFQTRTSDSRIQYGGNLAMAQGRSVVYGFHGESCTDLGTGGVGQANQFMHFLDNGLFVGQFGVRNIGSNAAVVPGRAGNSFSPALVRAGGRLYLYHNDESVWGGLHRWQLQGADDIVELSAMGELGSSIKLR